MKKQEFAKLKTKTVKELTQDLAKLRMDQVKATIGLMTKKEKNVKRGKMIRREIAQILGIIHQKENNISKA